MSLGSRLLSLFRLPGLTVCPVAASGRGKLQLLLAGSSETAYPQISNAVGSLACARCVCDWMSCCLCLVSVRVSCSGHLFVHTQHQDGRHQTTCGLTDRCARVRLFFVGLVRFVRFSRAGDRDGKSSMAHPSSLTSKDPRLEGGGEGQRMQEPSAGSPGQIRSRDAHEATRLPLFEDILLHTACTLLPRPCNAGERIRCASSNFSSALSPIWPGHQDRFPELQQACSAAFSSFVSTFSSLAPFASKVKPAGEMARCPQRSPELPRHGCS